jgi:hypothetical protein
MPVMVRVEVDEHVEDERVVTVVVGTEDQDQDITPASDAEQMALVYDESMEPPPRQGDGDNALVNDLTRTQNYPSVTLPLGVATQALGLTVLAGCRRAAVADPSTRSRRVHNRCSLPGNNCYPVDH